MSEAVNIPQLRFPEFGAPLKQATLGDFGYFYYGKSAPKWSVTEDAKTPCVRYGELYGTFSEYISEVKSHTNIPPENLKFSKGGEVLVPRVGEDPLDFANCSYLPIPNVAIGEMISVYNTKENGLFFTYYINAKLRKSFARVVEGGNVSNLYYKYLEDIKLTVPEIREQERVTEFLTAVDSKIEQLSKKQALLGEYKKGLMQQIFTQAIRFHPKGTSSQAQGEIDDGCDFLDWEEKKLGDVSIKGASNISANQLEDNNGDYKIYGAAGHLKNIDFYTEEDCYVAIVKDGAGVGRIMLLESKTSVLGTLAIIKARPGNDINFLYWLIQTINFRKYMVGSTIPHIYYRDYQAEKLRIPSLSEQTKIANFLSFIDSKIEQVGKQLDESKQFKKALLQQMFV